MRVLATFTPGPRVIEQVALEADWLEAEVIWHVLRPVTSRSLVGCAMGATVVHTSTKTCDIVSLHLPFTPANAKALRNGLRLSSQVNNTDHDVGPRG